EPGRAILKNLRPSLGREIADTDQPLRLKSSNHRAQVLVTQGEQRRFFRRRQFVRRPVAPAAFYEGQRAIIHHDVLCKKVFCCTIPHREESPQSLPADFRTLATESHYWPARM